MFEIFENTTVLRVTMVVTVGLLATIVIMDAIPDLFYVKESLDLEEKVEESLSGSTSESEVETDVVDRLNQVANENPRELELESSPPPEVKIDENEFEMRECEDNICTF